MGKFWTVLMFRICSYFLALFWSKLAPKICCRQSFRSNRIYFLCLSKQRKSIFLTGFLSRNVVLVSLTITCPFVFCFAETNTLYYELLYKFFFKSLNKILLHQITKRSKVSFFCRNHTFKRYLYTYYLKKRFKRKPETLVIPKDAKEEKFQE